MNSIGFRALQLENIPLLHGWLCEEHVRIWWSDEAPRLEQVVQKYTPRIAGDEPTRSFLIMLDGVAIGYVQTYRIDDYPADARAIDLGPGVAGIDLFIGEKQFLFRGLGPQIIERFLAEVVFADPEIRSCVVGPSVENHAAIRAYEKAGFAHTKTVQVPGENRPECLMVRTDRDVRRA